MHPIPADLDLSNLVGGEVIQVCLGCHQIQIHLQPVGAIHIECPWKLTFADETMEVSGESNPSPVFEGPVGMNTPTRIARLLAMTLQGWTVESPNRLTLRFSDGIRLTLIADFGPYECFQIDPLGIVI